MSGISAVNTYRYNLPVTSQSSYAREDVQVFPNTAARSNVNFTSKADNKSFLQKHWWKMLIGAGAVAAGIILTKGKLWGKEKPASFEKIQQNLAEIFERKDLTKEEAESLLQKYKEIYNIKDKNEFIQQAFNQVKKDLGYENTPIEVVIRDKIIKEDKGRITLASYNPQNIKIYAKRPKEEILGRLMHEFKHMKQFESMFRGDSKRCAQIFIDFYKILKDPSLKKIYDENPKAFEEVVEELLAKYFGHLPKFERNSMEYAQTEKYFEAWKNYNKDSKNGYKDYANNLFEQEAKHIGGLMQEVAKYIKNMGK